MQRLDKVEGNAKDKAKGKAEGKKAMLKAC